MSHRHVKLPEVIGFVKTKPGSASRGRRTATLPYILQLCTKWLRLFCLLFYQLFAQTHASSPCSPVSVCDQRCCLCVSDVFPTLCWVCTLFNCFFDRGPPISYLSSDARHTPADVWQIYALNSNGAEKLFPPTQTWRRWYSGRCLSTRCDYGYMHIAESKRQMAALRASLILFWSGSRRSSRDDGNVFLAFSFTAKSCIFCGTL